jgi:hypothetical protein
VPDSPLERAAGDPYEHGMEQRVSRLEDLDHQMATKSDIALLREDIAGLRGYMKRLPVTWGMVTAIVAGQVGMTGVIAIALIIAARMFFHT